VFLPKTLPRLDAVFTRRRGTSEFDVAAAGFELAGDEVDLVGVERGGAAEGDGGGDFARVENGDGAFAATENHPAGEGEDGMNGDALAEEGNQIIFEPAGLAEGLVETMAVFGPGVAQDLSIEDDLMIREAIAGATLAAGFGFNGEDAGGTDDDMIEVETRVGVACGNVVEDDEAVVSEGLDGLGDDAFAEVAEVAVSQLPAVIHQLANFEHEADAEADETARDQGDLLRAGEEIERADQKNSDEQGQAEEGDQVRLDLLGQCFGAFAGAFAGAAKEAEVFRKGLSALAFATTGEADHRDEGDK